MKYRRTIRVAALERLLLKSRAGTSLLISLGLITIIVLVTLGVTTVVVASIRESANINRATEAYYAAQGALELGLLENQKHGAGYTGNREPVKYDRTDASYQIQGTVTESTKYPIDGTYGIPTPGTGAVGKDCDRLNPYVNGTFWYSDQKEPHYVRAAPNDNTYIAFNNPQDHPCN